MAVFLSRRLTASSCEGVLLRAVHPAAGVGSIRSWGGQDNSFATLNLLIRAALFRIQQAAKWLAGAGCRLLADRAHPLPFVWPQFAAGGVVGGESSQDKTNPRRLACRTDDFATARRSFMGEILDREQAASAVSQRLVSRCCASGKVCAAQPASQANQLWAARRGKQGCRSGIGCVRATFFGLGPSLLTLNEVQQVKRQS